MYIGNFLYIYGYVYIYIYIYVYTHICIPTQFKAIQLVVAQAVWATQRSDPYFTYRFGLSIMHQNTEQCYVTIG